MRLIGTIAMTSSNSNADQSDALTAKHSQADSNVAINAASNERGNSTASVQMNDVEAQLPPRAIDLSMTMCHCCGLLNPLPASKATLDAHDHDEDLKLRCTRCRSPLHIRKSNSLERTLAFLIAASILYIPANVLPMTVTESLVGRQQDTIMSGVIYFWKSGDYFVSAVIFMASIFIPMLKLLILALLLIVVRLQASRRMTFTPESCAVLYRVVEFIGRWSMIDVFVVAMLAALIQIQSLATILAGTGAVAFGAVVILTMFASLSFDPRIIWDNYAAAQKEDAQKTQDETSDDLKDDDHPQHSPESSFKSSPLASDENHHLNQKQNQHEQRDKSHQERLHEIQQEKHADLYNESVSQDHLIKEQRKYVKDAIETIDQQKQNLNRAELEGQHASESITQHRLSIYQYLTQWKIPQVFPYMPDISTEHMQNLIYINGQWFVADVQQGSKMHYYFNLLNKE